MKLSETTEQERGMTKLDFQAMSELPNTDPNGYGVGF